MKDDTQILRRRLQALLLDWLIWAYMLVAVVYYSRDALEDSPIALWLYLGALSLGLLLALLLQKVGTTIGERLLGLAGEQSPGAKGAPWYRTQVGQTAALLAVVTFVLGWQITEINLYYVFTRADKMRNMTDRLTRPYWPVFGTLIEKMIETIFLALMATTIAIPLAALVSFFAARNLMYRQTTKRGKLLAGFIFAILGAWLGIALVGRALAPLQDTNLDTNLLGGLFSPILLLVGMALGTCLGRRLMGAALSRQGRTLANGFAGILGALLGTGVAYLLASLVAMIVFGASWRIFVREIAFWPYLVLAVGAVAGTVYASRQAADAEFAIGKLVYGAVRLVLNATRSIEPFVWALIFVTWFRLGPFPGTVALMVHSVAALSKLYSEQVESIDPGPLEAVRAAGATELQTIVYAVIPQIIPPFISFTIYRWDINVRMSTIIGLVGGGGVGQMLFQYQNLGQWRKVSVAVILIVAVVMTLDNVSAKIRERIL